MFGVFKIIAVLALICIVPLSNARRKVRAKHGPTGMNFNDSTTCEDFAKYARFNPYSVLDQAWFVFYYWGPPKPIETYVFTFPTANHTKHLHKILDGKTILPINWKARHILMENHKNKEVNLLVERGDRGQYWGFFLHKVRKGQKIRPRDIRIKQTGDNKIIGLMDCDRETVIAMCKLEEVPPKNRLQEEAGRLNYRARRGKSYLYEGHEWMPIPEADEKHYWAPIKKEKSSEESSKEVGSTSKEEIEIKKTDESLNRPKDQIDEDQSSLEQVDNESNNQTNLEAKEEPNDKEMSKELIEENNEVRVDPKEKPDKFLTNHEKLDINKKLEKKEAKVKPKPSQPKQNLIEPEVVTEKEEMELLTTSAPYSDQSSNTLMDENLDSKADNCKFCFTLIPRRRQSKSPKPETPDPQNSSKQPTDSQAMETKQPIDSQAMEVKHDNKASNEVEKVNDEDNKKDLNPDKNEV